TNRSSCRHLGLALIDRSLDPLLQTLRLRVHPHGLELRLRLRSSHTILKLGHRGLDHLLTSDLPVPRIAKVRQSTTDSGRVARLQSTSALSHPSPVDLERVPGAVRQTGVLRVSPHGRLHNPPSSAWLTLMPLLRQHPEVREVGLEPGDPLIHRLIVVQIDVSHGRPPTLEACAYRAQRCA